MNPLDVQRELEVHSDRHGASVRIPLTEPGDWLEWMEQYPLLARSEGLEAKVAPEPGHAVLTVQLPGDISREQTFQLLDKAVALIERAKEEANGRQDAARALDGYVRDWWATRSDPVS